MRGKGQVFDRARYRGRPRPRSLVVNDEKKRNDENDNEDEDDFLGEGQDDEPGPWVDRWGDAERRREDRSHLHDPGRSL
jgi:hypothetical protein